MFPFRFYYGHGRGNTAHISANYRRKIYILDSSALANVSTRAGKWPPFTLPSIIPPFLRAHSCLRPRFPASTRVRVYMHSRSHWYPCARSHAPSALACAHEDVHANTDKRAQLCRMEGRIFGNSDFLPFLFSFFKLFFSFLFFFALPHDTYFSSFLTPVVASLKDVVG